MKLNTALTSLVRLAVVARVAAQEKCGANIPEPEAVEAAWNLRAAHRAEGFSAGFLSKRAEGLLVPTYLHVVEDAAHAGFITGKMIDDQVCPIQAWNRVDYS